MSLALVANGKRGREDCLSAQRSGREELGRCMRALRAVKKQRVEFGEFRTSNVKTFPFTSNTKRRSVLLERVRLTHITTSPVSQS